MDLGALLFDKDGTLFGFAESWAPVVAAFLDDLAAGDAGRARALGRAIGFDTDARAFDPRSPVIAGTSLDVARILSDAGAGTVAALNRAMIDGAAAAHPVPAVPLAPLMADLRGRGLRLGVMTNDAEAAARAHLAQQGVLDAFDFIAGFDSGHGAKPDPEPLLAFADATGIAPARIAMVGDSLHDLRAGRAAGMATVAVLTGPAQAADLAQHADAVLPDIGHLPAWLGA